MAFHDLGERQLPSSPRPWRQLTSFPLLSTLFSPLLLDSPPCLHLLFSFILPFSLHPPFPFPCSSLLCFPLLPSPLSPSLHSRHTSLIQSLYSPAHSLHRDPYLPFPLLQIFSHLSSLYLKIKQSILMKYISGEVHKQVY